MWMFKNFLLKMELIFMGLLILLHFSRKKFEKYLEDVIFIYIFAAKRYDKKRSLK